MIPGLGSGRAIFLATGATDLRWGMNALYGLIMNELRREPLNGAIYGFCNRRRDTAKFFCFDTGGIWICTKRLEQGTFRWPGVGARSVTVSATDLALLLSGVDPSRTRLRRWWVPAAEGAATPR